MPHIDWGNVIALFAAVTTFWGIMWNFRREDRKERQTIRHETASKQEEQHRENQDKLDLLVDEYCERPNHSHVEREGPLMASGIRYRPRRNGGLD